MPIAPLQIQTYFAKKQVQEYGEASQASEEALAGIQTVHAYNGIEYERKKYNEKLQRAFKFGLKKSLVEGRLMRFKAPLCLPRGIQHFIY
jgi:ABC-type bacteriocin/lantibiotic exporter with double-glycine peptidase domain